MPPALAEAASCLWGKAFLSCMNDDKNELQTSRKPKEWIRER